MSGPSYTTSWTQIAVLRYARTCPFYVLASHVWTSVRAGGCCGTTEVHQPNDDHLGVAGRDWPGQPTRKPTVMTSMSTGTSSTATIEGERASHALVRVAAASFLVAAFFDVARANRATEALVTVAGGLVVVCLLHVFVVAPGLRRESAGGRALVLGVLAVLLIVPAFWSGLPMILGAGAALLGYAGRRAANGSGQATAAFVLGTLAMIGYVALYVIDWVANPGASWWS
jgi:hypothetical protein